MREKARLLRKPRLRQQERGHARVTAQGNLHQARQPVLVSVVEGSTRRDRSLSTGDVASDCRFQKLNVGWSHNHDVHGRHRKRHRAKVQKNKKRSAFSSLENGAYQHVVTGGAQVRQRVGHKGSERGVNSCCIAPFFSEALVVPLALLCCVTRVRPVACSETVLWRGFCTAASVRANEGATFS